MELHAGRWLQARLARCRTARLCAPFVGPGALEALFPAPLGPDRSVSLLFRFPTRDGDRPIDVAGLRHAAAMGVRLHAHDERVHGETLHAKVFVVDQRALVGSANLTRPGLGLGDRRNTELSWPVPPSEVPELDAWLAELTETCAPVGEAALAAIERFVTDPEKDPPPVHQVVQDAALLHRLGPWVQRVEPCGLAPRIAGLKVTARPGHPALLGRTATRTSGRVLYAQLRPSEQRSTPPEGVRAAWHFNLTRGEALAWRAGRLDFLVLVPQGPLARALGDPLVLWPASLQFRGHFLRAVEARTTLGRELELLDDGSWRLRIPNSTGRRRHRVASVFPLVHDPHTGVLTPLPVGG